MDAPQLIPLATLTITLGESFSIKNGPIGTRIVAEVASIDVSGERLNGSLASPVSADWLTVSPDRSYGTLDVRATLRMNDDAIVHMEYSGRIDFATGKVVSAPLFETGDEHYEWLNRIQAIGVGQNSPDELIYELFEVRPA